MASPESREEAGKEAKEKATRKRQLLACCVTTVPPLQISSLSYFVSGFFTLLFLFPPQ